MLLQYNTIGTTPFHVTQSLSNQLSLRLDKIICNSYIFAVLMHNHGKTMKISYGTYSYTT